MNQSDTARTIIKENVKRNETIERITVQDVMNCWGEYSPEIRECFDCQANEDCQLTKTRNLQTEKQLKKIYQSRKGKKE